MFWLHTCVCVHDGVSDDLHTSSQLSLLSCVTVAIVTSMCMSTGRWRDGGGI